MFDLLNGTNPALVWFIIGLVLLVLELLTPGLVIIFFGLGAWIVAVACLWKPLPINTQLIIFIIASPVILLILRNRFKSLFSGYSSGVQNPNKNMEDFIGSKAIVKETIAAHQGGKVELNGTLWSAEADEEIAVGSNVLVVSRKNLLLQVKKV